MVAGKARGKKAKAKPRAAKKKKAAKRGAGRPEYEPKAGDRERVEILIGGGMGIEETAAAMSMAPNTFKKHFGRDQIGQIEEAGRGADGDVQVGDRRQRLGAEAYIQLNALGRRRRRRAEPAGGATVIGAVTRVKAAEGQEGNRPGRGADGGQRQRMGRDLDVDGPRLA
jgi:hypothetical protein